MAAIVPIVLTTKHTTGIQTGGVIATIIIRTTILQKETAASITEHTNLPSAGCHTFSG